MKPKLPSSRSPSRSFKLSSHDCTSIPVWCSAVSSSRCFTCSQQRLSGTPISSLLSRLPSSSSPLSGRALPVLTNSTWLFCLVAAADYCEQGAAPEAIPVLCSFVSQFATWSNLRFLLYYTRCCFHLTASRCVYRCPAWVVVSETAVDVKTAASFCRSVMKEG